MDLFRFCYKSNIINLCKVQVLWKKSSNSFVFMMKLKANKFMKCCYVQSSIFYSLATCLKTFLFVLCWCEAWSSTPKFCILFILRHLIGLCKRYVYIKRITLTSYKFTWNMQEIFIEAFDICGECRPWKWCLGPVTYLWYRPVIIILSVGIMSVHFRVSGKMLWFYNGSRLWHIKFQTLCHQRLYTSGKVK